MLGRRRFLALGAGAVATTGVPLAGCGGSSRRRTWLQSPVARGARFPGDPGRGRLYYGVSMMPDQSLPELEMEMGHRLTVHRSYFGPDEIGALVAQAHIDHRYHRLPLVSTKLPTSWGAVAGGEADRWLRW